MAQWTISGRFSFDGHATVEAETAEEATALFDRGEFEVDTPTAALYDWERRGKPTKDE